MVIIVFPLIRRGTPLSEEYEILIEKYEGIYTDTTKWYAMVRHGTQLGYSATESNRYS